MYQRGAILSDSFLYRTDLGWSQFYDRRRIIYKIGELINRDQFAIGKRHLIIDLSDDNLCGHNRLIIIVNRDAQRNHAVFIGRCYGYQRYIQRHSGMESFRDLIKEARREISATAVDSITGACSNKICIVMKMLFHTRLAVFTFAHRDHVDNLDVFIVFFMTNHGIQQKAGFTAGMTDQHTVTGLDMFHRFIGSQMSLLIISFPIHNYCSLLSFSKNSAARSISS